MVKWSNGIREAVGSPFVEIFFTEPSSPEQPAMYQSCAEQWVGLNNLHRSLPQSSRTSCTGKKITGEKNETKNPVGSQDESHSI